MFFDIEKLRHHIDALYISLNDKGGFPKNWWWWDKKKERLQELSEEDELLIDDIVDLYEHAKILKHNKLVKSIEENATELHKHLAMIQEEMEIQDPLTMEMQRHQKDILKKIIHKLKNIVPAIEKYESLSRFELDQFIEEHVVRKGLREKFVFFRAEHIAEKPRLNEDSSGQLGPGVYFTIDKEIAKRFRSKPSIIFIFYCSPKEFISRLNPIFISKEDMKSYENLDPKEFSTHLQNKGYMENSHCVIVPIPDMGYVLQMIVEKSVFDQLVEEGIIKVEKGEEFNT